MSGAFTPGPWRLGRQSDAVVADTPAGHSEDAAHVAYYGGHLVAESILPNNRALIAAAPELLEALKALTHSLDADHFEHDDQRAAFKQARAAIAKATGEQA